MSASSASDFFLVPTAAAAPYWRACREGRLDLQRCADCRHIFFYPRVLCPRCRSCRLAWTTMKGTGSVYSFTVVRRGATPAWRARAPYVVAMVRLTEGPLLLTNLVDCTPEELCIGMPVRVRFREEGNAVVPVFAPAAER